MKKKIHNYFNRGAATYDQAAAVQTHVAKRLIKYTKDHCAKKILEIGCGTGIYSQQLITSFPKAAFLFTDIAFNMIEKCRSKFITKSNIDFQCIDGEKIDLFEKYDLITSSMTFHWFADIKNSLKALIGSLDTGGKLIFSLVGNHSLKEWQESCNKFEIQYGTPQFPLLSDLSKWFPDMHLEINTVKQTYPNARAFLLSLKKLGVRMPHATHYPQSAARFRKLFRHFSTDFPISYEIIYGSYTKA